MNILKNYFVLIYLLLHVYCMSAVTINGVDSNLLVKPGNSFVYTSATTHNCFFVMQDGNIEIGEFELNNGNEVHDIFDFLMGNKDQLYTIEQDVVGIPSDGSIEMNDVSIVAKKMIVLDAAQSIYMTNALLHSKRVVLIGNSMKFDGCFIDADRLHLSADSPASFCTTIIITFDKESAIPSCIQGQIDFESNQAIGDFIVVGVKEIEICFSLNSFDSD